MDKAIETKRYRPKKLPHARRGIVSLLMGLIAWIGTVVLCLSAFGRDGRMGALAGGIGMIIIVFGFIGFLYGIGGCKEDERRHGLAGLGIFLNLVLMAGLILVFVWGMM